MELYTHEKVVYTVFFCQSSYVCLAIIQPAMTLRTRPQKVTEAHPLSNMPQLSSRSLPGKPVYVFQFQALQIQSYIIQFKSMGHILKSCNSSSTRKTMCMFVR